MATTTEPEWCAQDLAVAFITAGRALLEALAHDRFDQESRDG